ncbi:RagB/SusD family nutrient uptake outer membrane protein [Mucilaginibacter lacusdianchii]|uniref:RagB/SusD family nutrient uptake outer membrane protein n=1 Tax=Mucilaginibacter lacusdianchii TaxID=2684211 RepID=UPI00131DDBE6|nr:RagB/SusD family nutrient uptake outer membrane protein [Mucilaginibacter sp. JXJ CY 39]
MIVILLATAFIGCKKQDDFLDTKPNQALAIPKTIADLQSLINNEDVFNRNYPSLGEVSTDDYFNSTSLWVSSYTTGKNAYIWAKEIYPANTNVQDWSGSYQQVYYANIILKTLPTISSSANQQLQVNTIQGSALFFRAMAFYNLVQTFALPYDPASASKDLGIPLVMEPDLTAKVGRNTISECYSQIITDLNAAAPLLPAVPTVKTQPSQAAVFGLLSRIYLVMDKFNESLTFAKNCLALYNQLQDFNKLNPSAFPVYPKFSPEEIFHASQLGYTNTSFQAQVDSNLYRSFSTSGDLRPSIFFYNDNGAIEFNSQYDYKNALSATISVNEILLTKAECEARLNDMASAMNDLNSLLTTRWATGKYVPLTATSADDALNKILVERRKELVLTGLRWSDLRRLNKESRFAITLYRHINGQTYSLPPNDPRYALPIPDTELNFNPIPQNIR